MNVLIQKGKIMRLLLTVLILGVFYSSALIASSLDALSIKGGYADIQVNEDMTNGGVADLSAVEDEGFAVNLSVIFNSPYSDYFKPYLDLQWVSMDDRDFLIPGVGIRHELVLDNKNITPFYSLGVGYNFSRWSQSPVDRLQRQSDEGESVVFTAQTGVDFYFTEHLAVDLTLRYDAYSIDTTIVENNRVSTVQDRGTLSVLAGLVYKFDQPPAQVEMIDTDNDGVNDVIDLCGKTLMSVPVNEAGCPQYRFDINLEFKFATYRIEDLVNQPSFDVVAFLQKNPNYALRITGYADSQGNAEFNQRLSRERAEQASDYLQQKGIDAERIEVLGRGENDPLYDNDSPEHRLANRRINLEFYRSERLIK
jgi:outer membrane protein OmpA-like peptidoglycan-associated protein/opacity protein-like surface antigen